MEKIIETHSAQETWQAGYEMGCRVDPGKVITLIGDLGVGKTVYTQGVAAGLGDRGDCEQSHVHDPAGL